MDSKHGSLIQSSFRQNGPAIREIRLREGWSVDKLANEVTRRGKRQGVMLSGPHLRNIENELRNASVPHLKLIADVLDCNLRAIRRDDVAVAS
jgi:transcriptional regulator with XRE-family HTH domain